MSQENVELVPAAYARFNRCDFDAVAAALHPNVDWHPCLGGLERTVYLNAYPTSNVLTLRLNDQVSPSQPPTAGPVANPAVFDHLPTRPRRRRW